MTGDGTHQFREGSFEGADSPGTQGGRGQSFGEVSQMRREGAAACRQDHERLKEIRSARKVFERALLIGDRILENSNEMDILLRMTDLHRHVASVSELDMPASHARGVDLSARRLDVELYLVGGNDGLRDQADVTTMRVSVGETGWEERPLMPEARRGMGCVSVGCSLFVFGGWDGNEALRTCLKFDLTTNSWSSIPSMMSARQAMGCCTVRGRFIYVIGGYDGAKNLSSVERYDTVTGGWAQVASMQCCRRGCAAVSFDEMAFAIGGSDSTGVMNSIECYHIYTNVWRSLPPMHVPRRLAGAAAVSDTIYVFGGWDGVRALSSCERYGISSATWEWCEPLAESRHGAAVVEVEDKVWVLGGWDGVSTARSSSVEVFSEGEGWSKGPMLGRPTFMAAAAVMPRG
eukprot:761161-Hanusia_phi.AAC.2